ncbi:MAG: CoA transferase subunit A [Desulfobacterales bacterium]
MSKLFAMSDAISRFVQNGSAVVLGTAQETLIPFAAGHELIRQRKRNLTLIGTISDILFDQVIGGGCVHRVRAAWVGNVITGSSYNFRRAIESGTTDIEDHSNLTMSMSLRAAAMGVPFMPARTALGSDLFKSNKSLKTITCPFSGDTLTAVAAIRPDVTIVHTQRADENGNAHIWGNIGITREACLASDGVIITTEEIVPAEIIRSDPNRVVVPGFLVRAVVHAPWGGHPSAVPGCYNRDHQSFLDYRAASRTPESFADWKAFWIDNVNNREDYLNRVGKNRMNRFKIKHHFRSEPADFGY